MTAPSAAAGRPTSARSSPASTPRSRTSAAACCCWVARSTSPTAATSGTAAPTTAAWSASTSPTRARRCPSRRAPRAAESGRRVDRHLRRVPGAGRFVRGNPERGPRLARQPGLALQRLVRGSGAGFAHLHHHRAGTEWTGLVHRSRWRRAPPRVRRGHRGRGVRRWRSQRRDGAPAPLSDAHRRQGAPQRRGRRRAARLHALSPSCRSRPHRFGPSALRFLRVIRQRARAPGAS